MQLPSSKGGPWHCVFAKDTFQRVEADQLLSSIPSVDDSSSRRHFPEPKARLAVHIRYTLYEPGDGCARSPTVAPNVGPVQGGGTVCGVEVCGGAACWVGMTRDAVIDLGGVASGAVD
jgi:hypothetical protein